MAMFRLIVCAVAAIVFAAHGIDAARAQTEKRVALVVGINDYPKLKTQRNPLNGQLAKAVADAEAMDSTLKVLGFEVELALNVDRTGFLTALDRVKRKIEPGDTFFFFFAGHGIAFRGSNLLLPSDIPPIDPEAEQLVRGLSIAETDIIEAVREKGAALTILTLDACRNNPIEEFAREQARIQGRAFRSVGTMRSVGLETRPTSGVFSIYSAGIGQLALDSLSDGEAERNSVFTRVFVRKLREPGRHLADVMEDVKEEVAKLAKGVIDPDTRLPHRQFPAYYNETQGGRVFLAGRTIGVDPGSRPRITPDPTIAPDEVFWLTIKDSSLAALFEEFLKKFPASPRATEARGRLEELKKNQVAVVAPPVMPAAPPKPAEPAVGVFPSVPSPSVSPHAQESLRDQRDKTLDVESIRQKYRGWALTPQLGQSPNARSIAFSPDGRRLVSGNSDATVKLWDGNSGRLIRTLNENSGSVLSVAYSADGRTIASGNTDGSVRLWDWTNGILLQTLSGHSELVYSVGFSPDGRRIASASGDKTVRVWDTNSGRLITTLAGHSHMVGGVTFSPDGRRIASASWDKTIKLWNVSDGRLIRTLNGHRHWLHAVAFSPDGRRIVSGSADKSIKIWDSGSGRLIRTIEGYSDAVSSVTFSPDGGRIASSNKHSIKLHDAETGQLVRTLDGHARDVWQVAFSSDGRLIGSASDDGTLGFWDPEVGQLASARALGSADFMTNFTDGTFSASEFALDKFRLTRGTESIPVPQDYKAAFMRSRTMDEIAATLK